MADFFQFQPLEAQFHNGSLYWLLANVELTVEEVQYTVVHEPYAGDILTYI